MKKMISAFAVLCAVALVSCGSKKEETVDAENADATEVVAPEVADNAGVVTETIEGVVVEDVVPEAEAAQDAAAGVVDQAKEAGKQVVDAAKDAAKCEAGKAVDAASKKATDALKGK